MCTMCVRCPQRSGSSESWTWSYRQFWVITHVLGTKARSSARRGSEAAPLSRCAGPCYLLLFPKEKVHANKAHPILACPKPSLMSVLQMTSAGTQAATCWLVNDDMTGLTLKQNESFLYSVLYPYLHVPQCCLQTLVIKDEHSFCSESL